MSPERSPAVPRVTAVVLNWCREDDTADCLTSLRDDYPGIRLLLVDNGSPDGSGERLHRRFPDVDYVQTGENQGYAGGNNRGIERALADGCDYVLVLNNDTVVEPGSVAALVEAAESDPVVGAVGAKILYHAAPTHVWFGGGDFSRIRALGLHRMEGVPDPDPAEQGVREVSFLTGCCLLIPARVLRSVGGFDEDFFAYVEDVDLSLRLRMAGHRLLYQPRARILHRCPLHPTEPSPFQISQRERNRRLLVRRHYSAGEKLIFALFFYPTRLIRSLQYLSRGERERARAIWRGVFAR